MLCAHPGCDLVEVGVPSTAATTPDIDVRVLVREPTHQLTELVWVTRFQMPERAQRNLVHQGGIGPQTPYPLEPRTRLDRRQELQRVAAVDAVERGRSVARLRVDRLDRLFQ